MTEGRRRVGNTYYTIRYVDAFRGNLVGRKSIAQGAAKGLRRMGYNAQVKKFRGQWGVFVDERGKVREADLTGLIRRSGGRRTGGMDIGFNRRYNSHGGSVRDNPMGGARTEQSLEEQAVRNLISLENMQASNKDRADAARYWKRKMEDASRQSLETFDGDRFEKRMMESLSIWGRAARNLVDMNLPVDEGGSAEMTTVKDWERAINKWIQRLQNDPNLGYEVTFSDDRAWTYPAGSTITLRESDGSLLWGPAGGSEEVDVSGLTTDSPEIKEIERIERLGSNDREAWIDRKKRRDRMLMEAGWVKMEKQFGGHIWRRG